MEKFGDGIILRFRKSTYEGGDFDDEVQDSNIDTEGLESHSQTVSLETVIANDRVTAGEITDSKTVRFSIPDLSDDGVEMLI